ncbi:TPA: hypothetical protein I7147_05540 [Vibrio vulnificus]|uniref:hypothetical protein n=1 Tax=Vibrio TaxID=662 RepID=UPI000407D927|nr:MULTISPECIES: hypothetical protein [Vibrio]MBY8092249.1 hypothetical protein [Vibrio fluvialis]EJR4266300.1 hypothetical protein [Vibrio vulnificus]ELQ3740320.1 hypothetical protein [Vibrio vulnificus]ELS5837724.1 hypothetical protein [Vibrio vulnificus]MCA0783001.1 hypothetical protein [Vibrio vulnificus]
MELTTSIEQKAQEIIEKNYLAKIEEHIQHDLWVVERVANDLSVTYKTPMFTMLPRYTRVKVIESLMFHDALTFDHIGMVEHELQNTSDECELDDMDLCTYHRDVMASLSSCSKEVK